MSHFDNQAIVIDNGSGFFKAGFAGNQLPTTVFPTLICTSSPNPNWHLDALNENTAIIGRDWKFHDSVFYHFPVEYGLINNWQAIEAIWKHVFEREMNVKISEHPILVSETPLNPNINREKLLELIFDHFNCPAAHINNQASLALYASGRIDGVVVDLGEGLTRIVPVYQGYVLSHAVETMKLAGHDITTYLSKLLTENGHCFDSTYSAFTQVQEIKEKLCYVADNFAEKLKLHNSKSASRLVREFKMPDGTVIQLGSELFRCTEPLFQPNLLLGIHQDSGIDHTINKCILNCYLDIRKILYQNIVLSGGSSLFMGLYERLSAQISELVSDSMPIKLSAPPDRKYSTWIGGSILASLSSFKFMWITKGEYEECGSSIVHRVL